MPDPGTQPGVTVEPIVTATVPTPHGYVFRRPGNPVARIATALNPRAETVASPCLAFVVRHRQAGTIVIDTGFHRDASESPRRDFGVPMGVLFRSLRPAAEPFDAQLRGSGVDPDQVQTVLMTHLHVDHTSAMRLLPVATFTCTRQEWQAAHGRLAAANGYVGHHLPPAARMDLVDVERDGVPHGPFAKTLDLLGDGTIRLVWTPGHTVGHQSILLALEDGRRALIVGDAAYTLRSIDQALLPMLTHDDEDSLRSMRQIKAFMEAEPDAVVVPTHDPTAWRALEATGQP